MKSATQSALTNFGLRVWGGSVEALFPPHRHNEIELNAFETGYFTYVIAGHEVTLSTGELGLFWGAIPHQVIRFAPMTRLYWATIPLDQVLRWELPATFVQSMLTGRLFRDQTPLYNLQFFSHWERDLTAGRQALVLTEIRALFFRFAQTQQPDPISNEISDKRTSQMAGYMSRHFHEPLSVADIAHQVGLHPSYAMTIFRKSFGLSLMEYVTQQRIAYAQQLLITSDAPILDVALESGFSTLSHFYTSFNRLCGEPPGKYRASLRQDMRY